MGNMFAPSIPKRAEPTPPSPNDPAIQEAERASAGAMGNTYGRAQTLLTSGQGVTTQPTISKKSLLGQ